MEEQKKRKIKQPTGYEGSSEARKNCGPTIFPTQYATNSKALTTLFLENPATFDVTTLKEIGRLIAYTTPRVNPTILPGTLSGSNFQIRSMPTTATMVFKIMQMMREDGMNVAAREVSRRKTISAPPRGICSRRALRSVKPNPAVMMAAN